MSAPEPDLRAIFCRALDYDSREDRARYLDSICDGDLALRDRVEALLAAHDEAGRFLSDPIAPSLAAPALPSIAEGPGAVIGPYKLLEEIGGGGMGVVYMAEQTEPVWRRVALKIIKPGMDTRQVIARFEAERQALALMDHPGIARVLDAGATESGRPYFVMELVRGRSVTEHCDEEGLTTRERLGLFVSVCHAVQHAHQKGVIHRDIKPSNVMVTLHDGTAVPKVIDFGVAKAIHQRLTERTLYTAYAQVVGTPLYMSPEQAEFSGLDVDTRSDIYSLGVLLYELLCGSTPFESERLHEASYEEIRRIIREEEPPTPSRRLSTLRAEALTAVAARRRVDPQRLADLVRGDLDWIVMKALEKDRSRRYESASAFAGDVERYLADEPVEARPPSRSYRLKKFVRRNRRALGAVTGVLLALLVGLGTTAGSIGWRLRERAEERARIEREVDASLRDSSTAREEAWSRSDHPASWEAKLAEARAAYERAASLLAGAKSSVDPDLPARLRECGDDLNADEGARRLVADLERIYLDRRCQFFDEPDHETCLYPETVAEYRAVFEAQGIREGAISVEGAAALIAGRRAPVREALVAAADDCIMLAERSRETKQEWLRSVVAAADRDEWRNEVRAALARPDRDALEALAERPEAVSQPPSTVLLLARALFELGAVPRALDVYKRAQERYPGDFQVNLDFAGRLQESNRPAEAAEYYRIALALRPEEARLHRGLGTVLRLAGDLPNAIFHGRRATELAPDSAWAYVSLAATLREAGDLDRAIDCCHKAISLKSDYAQAHNNLGHLLWRKGDRPGAVKAYETAIGVKPDYPVALCNLGFALLEQGELSKAAEHIEKALTVRSDYPIAHYNLGVVLLKQGKYADAIRHFQESIDLDPDSDDASAYINLGNARRGLRDLAGAREAYEKALTIEPESAGTHMNLAVVLSQQGEPLSAIAVYRQAIALDPTSAALHMNLAVTLEGLGEFALAEKEFEEALKYRPDHARTYVNLGLSRAKQGDLVGAIEALEHAVRLDPDNGWAQANLANALHGAGRQEECIAAWSRAVELSPKSASTHNALAWLLATVPEPRLRDPERAVELAERAVELRRGSGSLWNTLGVAQYRAGDYEAAVEALGESMKLRDGGDGFDWIFLAMIHWRLGDKEEAFEWYGRAVESMATEGPGHEELVRFRDEAEGLMGVR